MSVHDHDMNNMDSLFSRAAENYPLRVGDRDDWTKISGRLRTSVVSDSKMKKRRKYFGLLLLLVLILGVLFLYPGILLRNYQRALSKKTKTETKKEETLPVIQRNEQQRLETSHTKKNSEQKTFSLSNKTTTPNIHRTEPVANRAERKKLVGRTQQILNDQPALRFATPETTFMTSLPKRIDAMNRQYPVSIPDLFSQTAKHDTTGRNQPAVTYSHNKNAARKNLNRGLYFGLMAGPDFSNVKAQPIDRTGYNLGLLTGYRLNRKVSFESGVLWSRRKYYSDGKYFSMSKVGPSMPSDMKIVTVDGQFSLFEVPIKFKYDFHIKNKSNLFFSTGILSNIYLKEQNHYLTEMNGVQEYHLGLYKNEEYSWLSSINISGGYEHSIGKASMVRFEPYLKIPLKMAGMGSMPVLSTGINVVIYKTPGK